MNSNSRNLNIDLARAFAVICVVLCHCTETIWPVYKVQDYFNMGKIESILRIVLFTIGRLGVPIFLFITGYFILNKNIKDDEDILKFYKNNLFKLIICSEIWILIYNIFLSCYNGFSVKTLLKNILFFEKVDLMNMWYIPMIIGMYIALPFVNCILNKFSIKIIKIPIIINAIVCFVMPSVNLIFDLFDYNNYSNILNIAFFGGVYGTYIILGYLISKSLLKNVKTNILVFGIIVFFILCCIMQDISYSHNVAYNIWYNSIFLLLTSILIFELFNRIKLNSFKCEKIVTFIAKSSLAIFFIHIIPIKIIEPFLKYIYIPSIFKLIVILIITFIFCLICIYIFSKFKFTKKYILYLK